jgi:hypothetical protein
VKTLQRDLPNQRHARRVSRTFTDHDHAWRQVDDEGPLLLGKYECDLCHVVWSL